MTRLLITTALIGGLFAAPALAQSSLSSQDQDFARKAAIGGKAEVDLGKLAKKNGSNSSIKDFGGQMVTDHGKASKEFAAIAKKDGFKLPSSLDAEHQGTKDKLSKEKGADFDRDYVADTVAAHQQTVQLFQDEAKNGQNPDVKGFAQRTLPIIQHHLQMAQQLAAKGTSQAAPAESSGTSMPRMSHN
jgi:putative membrane protein